MLELRGGKPGLAQQPVLPHVCVRDWHADALVCKGRSQSSCSSADTAIMVHGLPCLRCLCLLAPACRAARLTLVSPDLESAALHRFDGH